MNRIIVLSLAVGLAIALGLDTSTEAEAAGWSKAIEGKGRFKLVLHETAVLDKETGLVWERTPDITLPSWAGAIAACNTKNVDNRLGWRLPTIQELTSLVNPSVASPGLALPTAHPFVGIQSAFSRYFSATLNSISGPTFVWSVDFDNASCSMGCSNGVEISGTGGGFLRAWCVRGNEGVDVQ